MKKGQQVEGVVTRVDFPNKGIVQTDDGDLITVKNVLEGPVSYTHLTLPTNSRV